MTRRRLGSTKARKTKFLHVFVSYSRLDRVVVDKIVVRLKQDGHDVWIDTVQLKPGDNIQQTVEAGLAQADAMVVVVSRNSLKSKWIQQEFTTIALQQLSKGERRIIPVKIDDSPVPAYLADRVYIDMSENFDAGLEQLSQALRAESSASLAAPAPPSRPKSAPESYAPKIHRLRETLRRGRLTLVCGAGTSVAAGVPAWSDLLVRLLKRMMARIAKQHPLQIPENAAEDFKERYGDSSLILGKYLKNNLGRDFASEMRDALYASEPKKSRLIDSIVSLSRPQRDGKPLDSIITFNFDSLIEEALSANSINNKAIFSEAIQHNSDEIPIYHVHGYLPRAGKISEDTELVFSEDAYHSQFIDPFSWSNLILLNKLTQTTCLFVGISLTDPNMRRLLDVAWRKNPDKHLSHVIVKKSLRSAERVFLDEVSQLLEEQDANALGLDVLWIDDYATLPNVLIEMIAPDKPGPGVPMSDEARASS
jgi:TIR domain/SIR2-like domain